MYQNMLKWFLKQIRKECFVNLHENMTLFLEPPLATWIQWYPLLARINQELYSCMEPGIKLLMGNWTIITADYTKHVI